LELDAPPDELAGVPTTCERSHGSVDQLDRVSKGTHGLSSDRDGTKSAAFFCAQQGMGDKPNRPSLHALTSSLRLIECSHSIIQYSSCIVT